MEEYGTLDPRKYEPNDTLFFKSKASKKVWNIMTAKDVWRKDEIHNNYLKSKGYMVIRFWEREIECEIDRCIEVVKKRIQAFKRRKESNQITNT